MSNDKLGMKGFIRLLKRYNGVKINETMNGMFILLKRKKGEKINGPWNGMLR